MIFVTFPLMLGVLIPVVFLETWVARPLLGTNYRETFGVILKANAISTLIGVPLAWIVTLGLNYGMAMLGIALAGNRQLATTLAKIPETPLLDKLAVILFPSWIAPEDLYWTIPVAATALLVPTFFASWLLEAYFVGKDIEADRLTVRHAMFKANAVSYCFLLLAGCCWLAVSLRIHRG